VADCKAPLFRYPGPAVVLLVLVGVYIGGTVYLSYLRLEMFTTSNWDLGIFQQALYSTFHGHPLYEAGDWESCGCQSLLEIHPSFMLFILEPFYWLAPVPLTLFIIQSTVAATAAIPLYWIGLRVLDRPWLALAFAGVYLGSAPLIAANLFDFHLEMFLPLEIISLFFCWLTGRYRLGLAIGLIAIVTLEVAPFLVAFVALYFLLPPLDEIGTWLRQELRGGGGHAGRVVGAVRRALRRSFADRTGRYAWALFWIAVISFPILRGLEWYALPAVLPPAPNPALEAGLQPGPVGELGIGFVAQFGVNFGHKVEFWVFMLAMFGFLPLFAPRALLMELPWFLYTLQSPQISWTTIGFQYTAVALAPIAIAAIFGAANVQRRVLPWVRTWLERRASRRVGAAAPSPATRVRRPVLDRRAGGTIVAVFFLLVIALNVWTGPLNPMNQVPNGPLPGFNVEYRPPPGFQAVVRLAALIPAGAPVLASSNVFPLVANNLNAYALLWVPQPPAQLPFDPSHLPRYLFLASNQLFAVPLWLQNDLIHRAFGIVAEVEFAPPGAVYLWESSYTGPTTYY
jgi:uncharacterized membrane protein